MRQLSTLLAIAISGMISTVAGAANMPSVTLANKSDAIVEIVPLDNAHQQQIPMPLNSAVSALPPGAFLLLNHTDTPINVLVALWSYTDRNGQTQQRRYNCNGYVLLPSEPIVKAQDSALVTPDGCTMREYFPHLVSGRPMMGGNLLKTPRNAEISANAANLSSITITVDSIIFEDGRIWGPDNLRYYATVSERYWAAQSVAEDLSVAMKNGQEMRLSLSKIKADAEGNGDKRSPLRRYYAGLLERSPNPEQTLKLLKGRASLPEFQHIGGETK